MKRLTNRQVTLKPQDLLILLKIAKPNNTFLSYAELGEQLVISASEVHASINRAKLAHLIISSSDNEMRTSKVNLREFILYGAKYVFPATFGSITRGLPTSYAAAPLRNIIMQPNELPPVWPYPNGSTRGQAYYPLYPTAPIAAEKDSFLYEVLALFDAIRGGAARERALALELLQERLF